MERKLTQREPQKEAEVAHKNFLKFTNMYVTETACLLVVASCSFGVDGTGSKSDPELYEEYKQNMLEMGKQ